MGNKLSLGEIQQVEYNIMAVFADYCDRYSLNYMLTYGTLIGAVRHQGFIPWDDDIDVMMPRKDYEKFIQCYEQEQIPNLELVRKDSKAFYYPYAKLCDQRTVAKMVGNESTHGIWMDIFPIDNMPRSRFLQRIIQDRMMTLRTTLIATTTDFSAMEMSIKIVIKKMLRILGNTIGRDRIADHMDRIAQKYKNRDTGVCCAVVWQVGHGGILSIDDIKNREKIQFGDGMFYAPRNYKAYLTDMYGDFMKLPPESARETHHLDAMYK